MESAAIVRQRSGPVIAAGTLLGIGMGGFLDGIVLHQMLQWHQLLSNWLPPDTVTNSKVNMFWDGVFHLVTWTFTVIGLTQLWRLIGRADVIFSTTAFVGALIFGWGLLNVTDSVFDHYLFRFHNFRENVPNPQAWNAGFLVFGILQCIAGWTTIKRARHVPASGVSADDV
jgi:uncharacterized membrane protein